MTIGGLSQLNLLDTFIRNSPRQKIWSILMVTTKKLPDLEGINRIVIFGHSGFIGGYLERFFREHNPNIEVIGRSFPPFDLTNNEDAEGLKDIFDMNTAVIMCSAIKPNIGNDLDAFYKNVQMVLNLCRVLEGHPVKHLLYFSSAAVYGEDINNTNITEETPINARSYYGIAKYASERLLWSTFAKQENNSLIILRPPVVYGPKEEVITYTPSGFLKRALNKEKLALWGGGTEKREFVFIEDVAKLVHYLTFHEYTGVINVASGKSYTFKEALDIISRITSNKLEIDSKKRTKEKVDNEFDNKLIQELIPDFSFTNLEEGIKKTFDFEKKIKG